MNSGPDKELMSRLVESVGSPGGWIENREVLKIGEPLPSAPTGGNGIGRIGVDGGGKGIYPSLIGVRRLIDNDIGAGCDTSGLFDIECGFDGVGSVARGTGPAINIDNLKAIWVDSETERIPVAKGVAGSERSERDYAECAALAGQAHFVKRIDIIVGGEIKNCPKAGRVT